jgi:acyl-[acyl-carrier-protein] desaturase
MPSQCLRQLGVETGIFSNFSDAAQRIGVYTSFDYIDIMKSLIDDWKIDSMSNLKENGEKARDYIMALPDRMTRIAERIKIPETEHKFNWILA